MNIWIYLSREWLQSWIFVVVDKMLKWLVVFKNKDQDAAHQNIAALVLLCKTILRILTSNRYHGFTNVASVYWLTKNCNFVMKKQIEDITTGCDFCCSNIPAVKICLLVADSRKEIVLSSVYSKSPFNKTMETEICFLKCKAFCLRVPRKWIFIKTYIFYYTITIIITFT